MICRRYCWLAFVALCFVALAVAEDAAPTPEPPVELYEYDASRPLNPHLQSHETTEDWAVHHLTYDGADGDRVPALLGLPKTPRPPHPLVICQHGLRGHKDVDYTRNVALALAREGYATLRIDARQHGERATDNEAEKTDRLVRIFLELMVHGGWVQTIIDQRRGIDYCRTRDDIDCERIGYVGMSMGAIMGGITCGVDERIDAAVLVLGGALGPTASQRTAAMDPATFIPLLSPRPLLMLNGKHDRIVRPEWTKRLFAAAKEPKRIVWYDTGHTVPPERALAEISTFLNENVRDAG